MGFPHSLVDYVFYIMENRTGTAEHTNFVEITQNAQVSDLWQDLSQLRVFIRNKKT